MKQHTPEPWRVEFITVWSKDFRILQTDHCGSNKGDINQANANRIVTCVNACAGITNPESIQSLIKACDDFLISIGGICGIEPQRRAFIEALAKLDAPSLEGNQ